MYKSSSAGIISVIFKLIGSVVILGLFVAGILIIWASTLPIPTLDGFENRVVQQTTKIYDRTGETLLYDVYKNVRRTIAPLEDISPHMRNATIAIEDDNFYNHAGIEPTAILRAVWVNTSSLEFSQGGSTLTQQVVKNSLLTREKTVSRKLKEWILSIKLDSVKTKDEILEIYLNEAPYGGSLYGVQAASESYFNKPASLLSIAESAYLAALPKAPTYYSPYGSNRDELNKRKNQVLEAMKKNGFISEEDFQNAKNKEIDFEKQNISIQSPHFVMYVREYVAEKYGEDILERGGFKIKTTLDTEMQEKAQEIVTKYALENEEKFNAENAGMVVINPQTGEILAMIGSRGYFDQEIDGNFNITTAHRQPGSAFKPFAYAEAFKDGYTPDTILFNLRTQFSTACSPTNMTSGGDCYSPVNYDGKFSGPMTMRDALAQSVNVPAIKTLYLAGLSDTLSLARSMGIRSLEDTSRYGLTLVLGGGEVSLLDITSAYSVFANEGKRNEPVAILEIEDNEGNVIENFEGGQNQKILEPNIANLISDVLSDNDARSPAFGENSFLHFPNHDIASKTGTTNDYRDAWIIGYAPNLAVGSWAGNNDNSPMDKKVAGFIVAPMWREFMDWALEKVESKNFTEPYQEESPIRLKPVLRGGWNGGLSYLIDKNTGKLATSNTPDSSLTEIRSGGVHSILHWVQKDDPRGPYPDNPAKDPQYSFWEFPVRLWVNQSGTREVVDSDIPDESSDINNPENAPKISIIKPDEDDVYSPNEGVVIKIKNKDSKFDLVSVQYYLNGAYIGRSTDGPDFTFSFVPSDVNVELRDLNMLSARATDEVSNEGEATGALQISF